MADQPDPKEQNSATFYTLAKQGDLPELIEFYKKHKASIDTNWRDESTLFGNTALIEVAWIGRDIVVQWMLKNTNVDVNARNKRGETALMRAAEGGFLQGEAVVQILLDHGANVNARNVDGETALQLATKEGRISIVRILLEHGATCDTEVGEEDPLVEAVQEGHDEILAVLLKKGASPNVKLRDGRTLLMLAAKKGQDKLLKTLISYGADIHARSSRAETVLMVAVRDGTNDAVQYLLELGGDINTTSNGGETALIIAVIRGRPEIVRMLLERGANAEIMHSTGANALMIAASQGYANIVQTLVSFGASSRASDIWGESALMKASSKGFENVVGILLANGADVNEVNQWKETPLIKAASFGNSRVVKTLIDNGADIDHMDYEGKTALDRATELENLASMNVIKTYMALKNPIAMATRGSISTFPSMKSRISVPSDSTGASFFGRSGVVSPSLSTTPSKQEKGSSSRSASSRFSRGISQTLKSKFPSASLTRDTPSMNRKGSYPSEISTVENLCELLASFGATQENLDFVRKQQALDRNLGDLSDEYLLETLNLSNDVVSKFRKWRHDQDSFAEPLSPMAGLIRGVSRAMISKPLSRISSQESLFSGRRKAAAQISSTNKVCDLFAGFGATQGNLERIRFHQVTEKDLRDGLSDSFMTEVLGLSKDIVIEYHGWQEEQEKHKSTRVFLDLLDGNNSNILMTEEEIEIANSVARRREQLRKFATSREFADMNRCNYEARLASSIDALCVSLTDLAGILNEATKTCESEVSRDSTLPVFDDPEPIYRQMTISQWLASLRHQSSQLLSKDEYHLGYQGSDISWLASNCIIILERISSELKGEKRYDDLQSSLVKNYNAATVRKNLSDSIAQFHGLGVDPSVVAEELASVALYTLELPESDEHTIIRNQSIHGNRPALYGVMNWSIRVYRDSDMSFSDIELDALEKTIRLFLPLLARIDVCLSRLPLHRTTLYRGIRAHISATKYKMGSLIPWTQLSSTSGDFRTAHAFGYSLFIAHVHNAPIIDFASAYPQEAEHLLPSYTWVKAVSVMSPTLLRILGSSCNYVTLQSVGDEPTIEELVDRLIPKEDSDLLIYEKFMVRFVEPSLHPSPPPLPEDAKLQPLFSALKSFLAQDQDQHMLLLGSGGSGKSAALLAAHCKLSRQSRKAAVVGETDQKPLISVFVSLPSSQLSSKGSVALDSALLSYLGVRPTQLDQILQRCTVVVFFDSLDECGDEGQLARWFPLLGSTHFCKRVRVVVSCRTEYLSQRSNPAECISRAVHGQECRVLHVQPFSDSHVDLFLKKTGIKGCNLEELRSVGVTPELQSMPIALRMGVELIKLLRNQREVSKVRPMLSWKVSSGSRLGLYLAYLSTCRWRTLRHTVDGKTVSGYIRLENDDADRLLNALHETAVTMLAQGSWSLPLSQVLRIFKTHFKDSTTKPRDAIRHSPMRVESLEDPDALFSFWHKSIGEFLCASAFWSNDFVTHLQATASGTPFSLREPQVLSFFNELAMNDVPRRAVIGKYYLEDMLKSAQQQPGSSSNNLRSVIASNVLSLLAVSQHPMHGADLRMLHVTRSIIYQACLRNALMDGSRFEDCDFNRTEFEGVSIEGAEFIRCSFGPLRHPPLRCHRSAVNQVCLSPDGKFLVSCSADETISMRLVENGRFLKGLLGHGAAINSVSWRNDGKLIASGSTDATVRIWDVATGGQLKELEICSRDDFHKDTWIHSCSKVVSVSWSPDGTCLAAGTWDATIRIWNLITGFSMITLGERAEPINAICWDPTSERIASASTNKLLTIWDVSNKRKVKSIVAHEKAVTSISWSANGRFLASGSEDCTLCIWNAVNYSLVKRFQGHGSAIEAVSWTSDSKIVASGAKDKTIRLWSAVTWQEMKKLQGHQGGITSLCWSFDDKLLVSGSEDRNICIWEPSKGHEVDKPNGHRHEVTCVAWSMDGLFVASGSLDNTIRVWDVATGRQLQKLQGHANDVICLVWSSDGKSLVSGSKDCSTRLWDATSGRVLNVFKGHNHTVTSVSISANDELVTAGSEEGLILVWQIQTGNLVSSVIGPKCKVLSMLWSPDSKSVACGCDDGRLHIWKVPSGEVAKRTRRFVGFTNIQLRWTKLRELIAYGFLEEENAIWIWNVISGEDLHKFTISTKQIGALRLSPEGKYMAVAVDQRIKVYNVHNGKVARIFQGHCGRVVSLSWSRDSRHIASGSQDESVRVWTLSKSSSAQGESSPLAGVIAYPQGLVLGRQSTMMPPFRAIGNLGPESSRDPFLSRFLFASSNDVDS